MNYFQGCLNLAHFKGSIFATTPSFSWSITLASCNSTLHLLCQSLRTFQKNNYVIKCAVGNMHILLSCLWLSSHYHWQGFPLYSAVKADFSCYGLKSNHFWQLHVTIPKVSSGVPWWNRIKWALQWTHIWSWQWSHIKSQMLLYTVNRNSLYFFFYFGWNNSFLLVKF